MPDPTRLSKTISHALRHEPETYGVTLDADGWTGLDDLLAAIGAQVPALAGATLDDVQHILATSDKQRWEIEGGRIRASYGHSIAQPIAYPEADVVPTTLYHGTPERSADVVAREGLKPMSRQKVHLSATVELAARVGSRRGAPVVIDTGAARAAGSRFSRVDDDVYVADVIPPTALHRLAAARTYRRAAGAGSSAVDGSGAGSETSVGG
ncbi:RNA 2'-phosphotransferase [Mesorhizobium japonicum]|uniref:RNA 2'-phosphotransferase n=1 Tax=Mesorhizobium japonicum TaxID=2066070 RepID=UPI003B58DEB2